MNILSDSHRNQFEPMSQRAIGCAIEVHRALGPGLLESTYRKCLSKELDLAGIDHECERSMRVVYKGLTLDLGYRLDIVIGDELIIELKSVQKIESVHKAQILTYLKFSGIKTGLLMNFNVTKLTEGLKRFVT